MGLLGCLLVTAALVCVTCQGKTVEEYMNTCMTMPMYQKPKPSPEPNLFGECASWREKACCQYNTTEPWELEMFDFNWNHCPQHRNLSDSCRRYLTRDICFNQCSPYLGPWNVMGPKRSRHVNLPLCQSTCDEWWNACKDSFTCVANWWKDFDYSSDNVKCPADSTCKPISQTYANSTQFCETIWHDSYKVAPDDSSCLVFYFSGENPNAAVGRRKAEELASGTCGLLAPSYFPYYMTMLILFANL